MRKRSKNVLIFLFSVFTAFVLTIVALTATGPGQQTLLRIATWFASSDDFTVRAGKLDGSLFGEGSISRVSLGDQRGVWAEFDEIAFGWDPWQLLSGRVSIDRLTIVKANIRRQPAETETSAGITDEAIPTAIEDSFGFAPTRIGRFEIDETVLKEAVLGTPARLALSGAIDATAPTDIISGNLQIRDLDRPSFVTAKLNYRAATNRLTVDADAKDEPGGVLSSLLDMDSEGGLRLSLKGSGTISEWRGDWELRSQEARLAGGRLALDREQDRLAVDVRADGEIHRFLPPPYDGLLAGQTDLTLQAALHDDGRYRLEQFALQAPLVEASASGRLDLAQNQLEGEANVEIRDRAGDRPVSIPLSWGNGESLAVRDLTASFSARPEAGGTALSAKLDANRVAVNGDQVDRLSLQASAVQPEGVSAFGRRLDAIDLAGQLNGIVLAEPALQDVFGETAEFALSGRKDGSDLLVETARLTTAAGQANANGTVDMVGFEGQVRIRVPEAARLARLADRPLSGRLDLTAEGIARFDGFVNMTVKGEGENVAAGADLFGKLLAGTPALDGRVRRTTEGGLRFDSVDLQSEALDLRLDGGLGDEAGALNVSGRIGRLDRVFPNSSGALQIDATIEGTGESRSISARLTADEATIRNKTLRDVVIRYDGRGEMMAQQGELSASGTIGGKALQGSGQLSVGQENRLEISGFVLALGDNRMEADAVLPRDGRARGTADIQITNAEELAPLLGVPMEGAAELTARLSGDADAPKIDLTAQSSNLRIATAQTSDLRARLTATNILERPVFSGTVDLGSLEAGGSRLTAVTVKATPELDRTLFEIAAQISEGWDVSGEALVNLAAWQPEATLRDVALTGGDQSLDQQGEARLRLVEGTVRLDELVLAAGEGRINATVGIGDELSGAIRIETFPAQFAAAFAPGIEPRGVIEGQIDLAGTAGQPAVDYSLSWGNAALGGALPPDLPAVTVSASGQLTGPDLSVEARTSGVEGLSLTANGTVADALTDPKLDLRANGAVPLSLANNFLAARGTRMNGRANVDLSITGEPAQPKLGGQVTASGATFIDPESGLDLKGVSLTARLENRSLVISQLSAQSEQGGTLTGSGTIGILDFAALPADLQAKANGLRFDDQTVASGQLSGDLGLKGELNGKSTLSGQLDIARLDIQIPNTLPSNVQELQLKHVNAPPHIAKRQKAEEPEEEDRDLPTSITLAIDIRSANRIFVTGRGLNAQLGGSLRLEGTTDEPRAIGEFTLERGRLAVLGRTLDFTSGSVNFDGDLDPVLNFIAVTEVEGTRIEVKVSGQASSPQFSFTSQPELPEDEVLALLLFNKSIGELSPLQVAQLASEVSALGGVAGGAGLLGSLRSTIGLDTLNLTTTEEGGTAVSAGSYLDENVYVGVEQGTSGGDSKVKVDLDITKNLKLRGEAGTDGESKLGVGVEWEY